MKLIDLDIDSLPIKNGYIIKAEVKILGIKVKEFRKPFQIGLFD